MESVPHRDFLYTATSSSSNLPRGWTGSTGMSSEQGVYFPLSTPTSRELSSKLKKSRRIEVSLKLNVQNCFSKESYPLIPPHSLCPQNRRLYRVASIVDVCDGFLQVRIFRIFTRSTHYQHLTCRLYHCSVFKDRGWMT